MTRWMPGCLLVLLIFAVGQSDACCAPPVSPSSSAPLSPSPLLASVPGVQDSLNLAWILLCGFLVFFMQAGFAMVETGLTRAKNVAHTMAMNVVVYSIGVVGFWACGFALMFGGHGPLACVGSADLLHHEFSLHVAGKDFGLFGYTGFFLDTRVLDFGVLALFLFHVMFLDTAATIPTGALAERWKFLSFVILSFVVSMLIYPVYGNWVWGGGWLARLGANFGLGHGHVDFAGSSVVHLTGGLIGLAGARMLGPRLGKYRPDGRPNPLPAHSVPLYMVGTLTLAFGWFGFNAGSALGVTDGNVARIAVNTVLSSAAAALTAMGCMWRLYTKPDPSFLCNGTLAGLVAITASCAYVAPWAAVLIGVIAGVLVITSVLCLERVWKIDDPVGAISVHGACGAWGVVALGLFADGTYAPAVNFNGVAGNVTGLFYGDAAQLGAQGIGLAANVLWVFPVAYAAFRLVDAWVGNRVSAHVEHLGLDVPELGALGYITPDAKTPEGRTIVHLPAEPRAASVPPNGSKRFNMVVDGPDVAALTRIWSELCQIGDQPPPPEFKAVYPYMTTMQGNRFRFRGGDPQAMRVNLERLLQDRMQGQPIRVRIES